MWWWKTAGTGTWTGVWQLPLRWNSLTSKHTSKRKVYQVPYMFRGYIKKTKIKNKSLLNSATSEMCPSICPMTHKRSCGQQQCRNLTWPWNNHVFFSSEKLKPWFFCDVENNELLCRTCKGYWALQQFFRGNKIQWCWFMSYLSAMWLAMPETEHLHEIQFNMQTCKQTNAQTIPLWEHVDMIIYRQNSVVFFVCVYVKEKGATILRAQGSNVKCDFKHVIVCLFLNALPTKQFKAL